MSKRQLTEEEKKLTESNIKRIKAEQEYLDFQLEYHNLMLNKGLQINYERKIRELTMVKKQLEEERKQSDFLIDTAKDQIANGVEEKEPEVKEEK